MNALVLFTSPGDYQVELGPTPVPTPAPVIPTGPFGGSSAVVPGLIEAEGYDFGGQGVGYFDTDAGNNGGVSDHPVDSRRLSFALILLPS